MVLRKVIRLWGACAALAIMVAGASIAFGQTRSSAERFAVFVSQRNGASELFMIDLETRQVSQLTNTGRGHLSPTIAADSRQIAYAARTGSSFEIFRGELGIAWRTRRPAIVGLNRLTVNPMDETSPSLSADASWLAFSSGYGIEMMRPNGAGRRIVVPVSDDLIDFNPVISPDASRIAFVSNRGGAFEIWLCSRTTGELRQLTAGASVLGGLSWSADSSTIAFTTAATGSKLRGIAIADAAGGTFRVLSDQNDSNPSLSARGDRLIFTSMRDGDAELYLMDLASGRVERLTRSMGVDDSAVFVGEPARPERK
ncbi:MAG: PD40 domain-containing protein [Acidobacteriota bacterium]|nr:MAG: PD40 domain-containing protein [Acidobacteriota bacterium]